jgi:hydrogenase maturation protease
MGNNLESTAVWNRRPRVLAVGLGNSILQDNGVGVHAVRRFQQLIPRPCLSVEVGTAVYDAVKLFESADRILAFDAVEAGGQPGSVYLFRAEDIMEGWKHTSLHEMELVKVLQTLRRPPVEVVIVGAEPQAIDWGINLSPALDFAVSVMIATAQKVITKWKSIDLGRGRIDLASITEDSRSEIRDHAPDLHPVLKRSLSA